MKKLIKFTKPEKGFTLIEVILTIVFIAILGSFLVAYMGTAITKSTDPIFQAQNIASSEAIIEKISADYVNYVSYISGVPGSTSATWNDVGIGYNGTGYNVNISGMTQSNISIFGGNLTHQISSFAVKEVVVTKGDQKLVSYFMQ